MGWFSGWRFWQVLRWQAGIAALIWALLWGIQSANQWMADRDEINQFTATSFAADYTLGERGEVSVVETITVDFPPQTNHGITRELPSDYRGRPLHLSVSGVTRNAQSVPYAHTPTLHGSSLRIGDPATFVSGPQTYVISYRYSNAIQTFGQGQEFFWDVNGQGWAQDFGSVTATVHLPTSLAARRTGTLRCFDGANAPCTITDSAPGAAEGSTITATALQVGKRSTMTISVPFTAGTVPDAGAGTPWQSAFLAGLLGLWALVVAIGGWWVASQSRRFMSGRLVVPEFTPPDRLSPAVAAELYAAPGRGIVAQLLTSVLDGHITLTTDASGDVLARNKSHRTPRDPLAKAALTAALGSRFKRSAVSIKTNLKQAKKEGTYVRARRAYLKSVACPVLPFPTAASVLLGIVTGTGALIVLLVLYLSAAGPWGLLWQLGWALISAAAYAIAARWVGCKEEHRPTFAHLEGLRAYIARADADRLAVLQSAQSADRVGPEQEITLYEKLLPWAVVLGVEQTWLKHMGAERLHGLDWYAAEVDQLTTPGTDVWSGSSAIDGAAMAAGGIFGSGDSGSGSDGGSSGGGSGDGGGGGGGGGW